MSSPSNLNDSQFIGLVVGVSVGAVLIIVCSILLLYYFCCLKQKHKNKRKYSKEHLSKNNSHQFKRSSSIEKGEISKENQQSAKPIPIFKSTQPWKPSYVGSSPFETETSSLQKNSAKSSTADSGKSSQPKSESFLHQISHQNAFKLPGLPHNQSLSNSESDLGKINPAYISTEDGFDAHFNHNSKLRNGGVDPMLRPISQNLNNYRPISLYQETSQPMNQPIIRTMSVVTQNEKMNQYYKPQLRKFDIRESDKDKQFLASLPDVSDPSMYQSEASSINNDFSSKKIFAAHSSAYPPVMRILRRDSMPTDTRSINSDVFRERGREITSDAFDFLNDYADEKP